MAWQIIMHYTNSMLPWGQKKWFPTYSSFLLKIILAKRKEVEDSPQLSVSQEYRSSKTANEKTIENMLTDFWVFIDIVSLKTHYKAIYLSNTLFYNNENALIHSLVQYWHLLCVLSNGDAVVNKTMLLLANAHVSKGVEVQRDNKQRTTHVVEKIRRKVKTR